MINVDQLTIDHHSPQDLEGICRELAPRLAFNFGLDKFCILMALAGVETSFGKLNRPRHEVGYAPGGAYFKNLGLQGLYKHVGALASCSWGPWQIMAVKAMELGYDGNPAALHDGRVSGPVVVKLLNLIGKDAQSMDQVLDAYNTGSFRVGEPPKDYISKFWTFYGQVIERKLQEQEGNV